VPEDSPHKLLGRWTTDPTDTDAIKEYGGTTVVFSDDGGLTYIIHVEGKDQVILMNYRIEDSVLVTDQPSQPGEERTVFSITPEGKLVLEFGGIKSRYVRSSI
jgi:hypothetical protein